MSSNGPIIKAKRAQRWALSSTNANDIIAKAIALANEMLSENSRSSSISDDRPTAQNSLNMNALIKGQRDARWGASMRRQQRAPLTSDQTIKSKDHLKTFVQKMRMYRRKC